MSDILYVDATIRLEEHDRGYSITPGDHPLAIIDIMSGPALRLRLVSRTPDLLYDLADNLRELANDLEVAQRPYVGDEDADSPALALMKRGLAEMRDDLALSNEDAEWSLPLYRTEAGYPRCATCDGGGCPDCTEVGS